MTRGLWLPRLLGLLLDQLGLRDGGLSEPFEALEKPLDVLEVSGLYSVKSRKLNLW